MSHIPEAKASSVLDMTDNRFSSLVLYLTFCLIVFYPFKGVISFIWSSIFAVNLSVIVISFLFIIMSCFVLLNLIVNHLFFPRRTDIVLFVLGFVGVAFALFKVDNVLLHNTLLLFFLPVLFSPMQKIDEAFFYKAVFLFFTISTIYLLAENIVLHPARFGLSFKAPNHGQLCYYTSFLVSSPDYNAFLNLDDIRHTGLPNRTGGYLGNILAMPVLISMAATFFYVSLREKITIVHFVLTVISVFLLISCLSTTAIIAFILTIIFYEFYTRRNFTSIFVSALIILMIPILLYFSDTAFHVYKRLLENLKNPQYFTTFFDHRVLLKEENYLYLIFGRWSSQPLPGGSSHVDLVNIVVAYGGIITYMLYKRILFPLSLLRITGDIRQRAYPFVILTAFICLFHSTMTLNMNVMMLVTLLMVKSSQIHNYSDVNGNAEMFRSDTMITERSL